jgi:protein involved in polysaccharide export with SLBB domain
MNIKISFNSVIAFAIIFLCFNSISVYSQDIVSTNLSDEFLEGLPPSVRDQIEVQNDVQEEKDLEDLFRSDTSVEKNKVILNKLRKRLEAVDKRISGDSDDDGQLKRFGIDFFQSLQSSFMPINMPNMSSDYIVDVGDEFKLLLTGKISDELTLFLERDGSILIPEFGKVFIAGKTLKEAQEIVSSFLEIKSVGVVPYLSVSKVRDIQVLMLGGIESKGIFTISGGSNVLGAINAAGGIQKNGSFRKIEVRRGGETIQMVDLYDIFVFGNFNLSNALRSGDSIFVHPSGPIVPVAGGVNYEALYEVLPGDNLEDLIGFAGGFSAGFSGYDSVTVTRVDLNEIKKISVNLDSLRTFEIQSRDSLLVPSYNNSVASIKKVSIDGMVQRPGEYIVDENESLSSIIRRAGGYKENAYSYGGALFREGAQQKEELFAQLNYSDTVNYIVSSIGKPNTSVDASALDLLAEELRAQNFNGRIVANFNLVQLEADASQDIKLQNNDRIVIPSLEKVVFLFGDFKNPSNLTYNSNYQIKDYVKKVGGLKESSYSEILVIDPDGTTHLHNTRSILFGENIDIYPGTIVYAPRDIGKLSGVMYASSVAPILSSLALSLASLNSISD